MATYQRNDILDYVHSFGDGSSYTGTILDVIEDISRGGDENVYQISSENEDGVQVVREITDGDVIGLIGGPTHLARQQARETRLTTERLAAMSTFGTTRREGQATWTTASDMLAAYVGNARREPAPIPIVEATGPAGITITDYNPPRTAKRLYSFRLVPADGGGLVSPQLNDGADYYEFRDEFDNIWINKFQDRAVLAHSAHLRDINGIQWIPLSLLRDVEMAPRPGMRDGTVSLTRRKKLRRKYEKMPVIKDEKHYAGKEYIA
jgi:hypothetical protein